MSEKLERDWWDVGGTEVETSGGNLTVEHEGRVHLLCPSAVRHSVVLLSPHLTVFIYHVTEPKTVLVLFNCLNILSPVQYIGGTTGSQSPPRTNT